VSHEPVVAIAGVTGAVGAEFIATMNRRAFPVGKLKALASARSAGKTIDFRGERIVIEELTEKSFEGVDIALFSAGSGTSRKFSPAAVRAGAVVIDNSSAFRQDDDVPLVVSEVNPEAAKQRPRGIIANPNCSTMQMLVALAPIHRKAGIERINVATYQSVSGTGRRALEELGRQTAGLLNFQPVEPSVYPVQIAFNVIPHGGDFTDNGYTTEEMKLVWETRKILGDDSIRVNATVVRVPVFYGHSEAVNVETREHLPASEARALLEQSPGVEVVDEPVGGGYPTPVTHASGHDAVYVGRIRDDLSHPNGLNLWIVSDNIRKGAALNAVQIAELVIADA
jgi:aspartate-semialdehyde dehydrogenase